jgi:hypothetical protein
LSSLIPIFHLATIFWILFPLCLKHSLYFFLWYLISVLINELLRLPFFLPVFILIHLLLFILAPVVLVLLHLWSSALTLILLFPMLVLFFVALILSIFLLLVSSHLGRRNALTLVGVI